MPDLGKMLGKAKDKLFGKNDKKLEEKFDKEQAASRDHMKTLWPKGTWTLAGPAWTNAPRTAKDPYEGWPDMDFQINALLFRLWTLECFIALEEKAGRKLNPGMMGGQPDPVPAGWKPQKRTIEHWQKYGNGSAEVAKHVIAKLTALNNLR